MKENKTIAEMRHEVIDNTIRIELMLDNIIQIDMGFEPDYQEIGDEEDPEKTYAIIVNEKGIKRFKKFFLEKTNLERKFDILKDIIKEGNKSVPQDIWEKAKKIREIRNIFAHTLAPKYPYKPQTIGMVATDFDCLIKNIEDWEKLYEEHTTLFNEVHKIIFDLFYVHIDLTGLERYEDRN